MRASQEVPPGLGTDSAKGVQAKEHRMSGGGEMMDKVVSSFKQVLDLNEDTLMRECQAALSTFDKFEEEYKGSSHQSTFVEKLQEHHGTLKTYVEQLKMLKSQRAPLISHLKEALDEQELKGKQIGSMLQVAQSKYNRIDELCQDLGIDVERYQSFEQLVQEENSDEHNATTNVISNLAAGSASATSSPPASPVINWQWTGAKRVLTLAHHNNVLRTKYIIAEDRDRQDAIMRINEALSRSNPADGEYYFELPGMRKVVFDEVLMQFCLPKRDGYRICSTNNNATHTKAVRLGTLLMDLLNSLMTESPRRQKYFYYLSPEVYGNDYDGVFRPLLHEASMLLETSKLSLNISTNARGRIIGAVKLCVGQDVLLRSTSRNIFIPHRVHYVDNIKAEAEINFVLIVEKETAFEMLEKLRFSEKHKCVLISGRGYPDLPTRAAVYKLRHYLNIPVYGLFDLDRNGLEVMFTYKYGSRKTAFQNLNLTVTDLVWIGMHPHDFDGGNPLVTHVNLRGGDRALLNLVKSMPYMSLEPEKMNLILQMVVKKISGNIHKVLNSQNIEAFLLRKIAEEAITAKPNVESL